MAEVVIGRAYTLITFITEDYRWSGWMISPHELTVKWGIDLTNVNDAFLYLLLSRFVTQNKLQNFTQIFSCIFVAIQGVFCHNFHRFGTILFGSNSRKKGEGEELLSNLWSGPSVGLSLSCSVAAANWVDSISRSTACLVAPRASFYFIDAAFIALCLECSAFTWN